MCNRQPPIISTMSGKNKIELFLGILFAVSLLVCAVPKSDSANSDSVKKITFNLDELDENGLYGPPDGKRAISYEFCIPAKEEYAAEVQSIDSTVMLQLHAPGRIGCSENEYLCMGSTHQKNYQEVLFRLSKLEYIKKIEQSFFEQ